MARGLLFVPFFLVFLPGCAAISERLGIAQKEVPQPTAATQSAATSDPAKEAQPAPSDSPRPTKPVRDEPGQATAPAKQNISREHVEQAQRLLKASGFNPGPIDGILGPQTRAAAQKFHSGCVTLSKLLESRDEKVSQQTGKMHSPATPGPEKQSQPAVPASPFSLEPGKEEIRLVQKRLKASGFYPGPIDGILGPQTRAALQQELRAKYEY